MIDKKVEILACSIDEDQVNVAKQWANTFIHNSTGDQAVNMAQLLLACVAYGDFRVHSHLSKSSELQAPSNALNIVDYLSHASRVILDYQDLSDANKAELLAFFSSSDKSNIFSRTSTHNVFRDINGDVEEGKGFLLGLVGQLPGLIKKPQNFGLNIAMGGEGQENFYGKKIAANGFSGHLYFYRNDEENLLMLGLEQSAPAASPLELFWGAQAYPDDVQQHQDQFGQGHSLVGASDVYTAAGSLYFSDPVYQAKLMLEKGVFPPEKYGAMQVRVTNDNWPLIKQFLGKLQAESNAENKEQLLTSLMSKPSTAKDVQEEYVSYIDLNFQTYLKRVYQAFITDETLDEENQEYVSTLQSDLLLTIKQLQKGYHDDYGLFKEQIEEIIGIKTIPALYRQAICRIQGLFNLQLTIDPEMNRMHQEILLRNQYAGLERERTLLLQKLIDIQGYFQENPPTTKQDELRVFLEKLDGQIKHVQDPFASPMDVNSSWVQCEDTVAINVESIDTLRQTIEQANTFIQQIPATTSADMSFSGMIHNWQTKLLPLSQINLIDYSQLDLSKVAKQFNDYVDFLAQQAQTHNYWKHPSVETTNGLVAYAADGLELLHGHAFVPHYRESTILRSLFSLDPDTLGTLRFKPYEEPAAEYKKQHPDRYFSKLSTLLTAGSDVIASLRTLQKVQQMGLSWEEMNMSAASLQAAVERFQLASEELETYHSDFSEDANLDAFESPFFYAISDEALDKMNGVQLATIALEELNAKTPSILVNRIVSNPVLWQRMDEALTREIDNFKNRKEDVAQKITLLRDLHLQANASSIILDALNGVNEAELDVKEVEIEEVEAEIEEAEAEIEEAEVEIEEAEVDIEEAEVDIEEAEVVEVVEVVQVAEVAAEHFANLAEIEKVIEINEDPKAFEKEENQAPSIDLLLQPILDTIDNTLHQRLVDTALQDEVFKAAILKRVVAQPLTSVLIKDLFALKAFRDQKIALSAEKHYGSEYDHSINQFYEQALEIRLSSVPIKQQAEDIINVANKEFKHRHDGVRLAADVAMIVSAFFGVGILVGLGRLACGKTLFFSPHLSGVKTDREIDLTNQIAKDLPEDGEAQVLIAPGA